MKSTLLLCALAALCVIQTAESADSLNVLQARLRILQNRVDTVIRNMNRYQNNVKFDLNNKIFTPKINSLQEINNIVNPIINDIRNQVDAAKKEGKNAEQCYENARLSLRSYSIAAHDAINSCEKDAASVLDPVNTAITSVVQTGNTVKSDLNLIFPSCYSSNILQMQNCIALKIGSSNAGVNALVSAADSVKSSGSSAISTGVQRATSCFQPVISELRQKAPTVRGPAAECIKNA